MADIVLISGSPSPTSRSTALLRDLSQRLTAQGLASTLLMVRDIPAEDLIGTKFDSPAVKAAVQQVERARAVVVSTPVYKAAYSGILKTFLDLLPQNALRGKIALPLVTGGSPAHLLAIEYALKPVLSVLGASEILHGIYATDSQVTVTPTGAVNIDPELQPRFTEAVEQIAERLKRLPPAAL